MTITFFFRKFDSNFGEMDFKYKPSFTPINCEYITEDIIDTISMFPLIQKYTDWENLFKVLDLFKNQEVLSRQAWGKLLNVISTVDKSQVLLYIVQAP